MRGRFSTVEIVRATCGSPPGTVQSATPYGAPRCQKYIQRLGFGSTMRPINKESQDSRINTWGQDGNAAKNTVLAAFQDRGILP